MALISLFRGLAGLKHTAIENARRDGEALVIDVRPMARQRGRCGICRRRCAGYDGGGGRRRWRSLDHGTALTYLEADAPRVWCRSHGVVAAFVPWAAHRAGHTHSFDAQVAWLATKTSKAAVTELMRISWRTVGAILARYVAAADAAATVDSIGGVDGLNGLHRIGIDEISYRRGAKFLTVVVDHDIGRLVWAGEGRSRGTLAQFFDLLGDDRCAQITHVSADGASWVEDEVTRRCPHAVLGIDPFHVVAWANKALSRVRIDAWGRARALARRHDPPGVSGGTGRHQRYPYRDLARGLKGTKYALAKNPENLTAHQQAKLEWVVTADPRLYRAYLLKERLRLIFQLPPTEVPLEIDKWLAWARRSRIEAFLALARSIATHRDRIITAIRHRLSNGLVEAVNTKIRLLTRIAFGFRSPAALIALAMLSLGRHHPALPGRT